MQEKYVMDIEAEMSHVHMVQRQRSVRTKLLVQLNYCFGKNACGDRNPKLKSLDMEVDKVPAIKLFPWLGEMLR